jgi:hypothetical protein
MSTPRRPVAPLLALLLVLGVLALLPSVLTPAPAAAAVPVDSRLGAQACALTGRVYVAGRGCARQRCVAGARMFKAGIDAELCQRAGRKGAEYARPISKARCGELGRVWIGAVNSCASNPDRARTVVPHARQCTSRAATYLNHTEAEGYYDECVSPRRFRAYQRIARRTDTSVTRVARDRSRANCSYRGGRVMSGGLCVERSGPPPEADLGGGLMVGDSVSWRADDELSRLWPGWTLDLRPGRRPNELAARLEHFRADHGDPTRLVVQLGTNRRAGYEEADFRRTMATVPDSVPVMLLVPFRNPTSTNGGQVAAVARYAQWFRTLARERPNTCLVDWASHARANLGRLADGEHPGAASEGWYARYVVRSWNGCF